MQTASKEKIVLAAWAVPALIFGEEPAEKLFDYLRSSPSPRMVMKPASAPNIKLKYRSARQGLFDHLFPASPPPLRQAVAGR